MPIIKLKKKKKRENVIIIVYKYVINDNRMIKELKFKKKIILHPVRSPGVSTP